MAEDADRGEWQPATSQPGEMYTVEGQIASAGAFARGLRDRARRTSAPRQLTLRRTSIVVGSIAVVLAAAVLML